MPVGRELMMKPPPAAAWGFGRRPASVFGPPTAVACHRLALPHHVGRTVSGVPAARSCGNPCGTTRRDPAMGPWHPKPLVGLPCSAHVDQLRRRTLRATSSGGLLGIEVRGPPLGDLAR